METKPLNFVKSVQMSSISVLSALLQWLASPASKIITCLTPLAFLSNRARLLKGTTRTNSK